MNAAVGLFAPCRFHVERSRLAPLLAAAAVLAIVVGGVMLASNDGAQPDPIAAVVEADDAVAHSVTGDDR